MKLGKDQNKIYLNQSCSHFFTILFYIKRSSTHKTAQCDIYAAKGSLSIILMNTLTEQQREDILQYKHLQPSFMNELIQLNRNIRNKLANVWQQYEYLLIIKKFYLIDSIVNGLEQEYEDLMQRSKDIILQIEEARQKMNDQTTSLNRLKYVSQKQLAKQFDFTYLKVQQIWTQIGDCIKKEVEYFQTRKLQPQYQYSHVPVVSLRQIIKQRYQDDLYTIKIIDLYEMQRGKGVLRLI